MPTASRVPARVIPDPDDELGGQSSAEDTAAKHQHRHRVVAHRARRACRRRRLHTSLAAKLPMGEVEKHMAEIGLSNNLTQDELRTCRDGLQAQVLHVIFDAFGIPLPAGQQVM